MLANLLKKRRQIWTAGGNSPQAASNKASEKKSTDKKNKRNANTSSNNLSPTPPPPQASDEMAPQLSAIGANLSASSANNLASLSNNSSGNFTPSSGEASEESRRRLLSSKASAGSGRQQSGSAHSQVGPDARLSSARRRQPEAALDSSARHGAVAINAGFDSHRHYNLNQQQQRTLHQYSDDDDDDYGDTHHIDGARLEHGHDCDVHVCLDVDEALANAQSDTENELDDSSTVQLGDRLAHSLQPHRPLKHQHQHQRQHLCQQPAAASHRLRLADYQPHLAPQHSSLHNLHPQAQHQRQHYYQQQSGAQSLARRQLVLEPSFLQRHQPKHSGSTQHLPADTHYSLDAPSSFLSHQQHLTLASSRAQLGYPQLPGAYFVDHHNNPLLAMTASLSSHQPLTLDSQQHRQQHLQLGYHPSGSLRRSPTPVSRGGGASRKRSLSRNGLQLDSFDDELGGHSTLAAIEARNFRHKGKQNSKPSLSCWAQFAKFLLFAANFLFWLSGFAVAIWGIVSLVEDNKYNLSQLLVFDSGSKLSLVQLLSWSFITLGAASILVGFCGLSALIKNNRWVLSIYIFLILVIFALDLSTGLLAVIYQEKLVASVRLQLAHKLRTDYGVYASFTAAIDYIQAKFECCGLEGHFDYDQSLWRLQRLGGFEATVARTCCHLRNANDDQAHINPRPLNESMCQSSDVRFHQSYRFRKGCLDELETSLRRKIWWFIVSCCSFDGLILVCVLLATCLCRALSAKHQQHQQHKHQLQQTQKPAATRKSRHNTKSPVRYPHYGNHHLNRHK